MQEYSRGGDKTQVEQEGPGGCPGLHLEPKLDWIWAGITPDRVILSNRQALKASLEQGGARGKRHRGILGWEKGQNPGKSTQGCPATAAGGDF